MSLESVVESGGGGTGVEVGDILVHGAVDSSQLEDQRPVYACLLV